MCNWDQTLVLLLCFLFGVLVVYFEGIILLICHWPVVRTLVHLQHNMLYSIHIPFPMLNIIHQYISLKLNHWPLYFIETLSLSLYWFMVDSFSHALNSDTEYSILWLLHDLLTLSTGGANHSISLCSEPGQVGPLHSWHCLCQILILSDFSSPVYVELKYWYKLLSS